MTTQDTSVEENATLDYDADSEQAWLEQPEELPRRRRRKLLSPIPVALLGALLLAAGFLAGVEVEKGQTNSSSPGAGAPAGLAALRNAAGGGASGRGGARSLFGAGGGGGSLPGGSGLAGNFTRGEVSFVSGNTLYVTSGEGSTVKVNAPEGTQVSKTVSTSLHSIHPGDTVTVTGSQGKNGSVTASSISIGRSSGSSGGKSSSSESSGAGAVLQLFGSG